MQTRSKRASQEYARSVDDSINENQRHTKKRKAQDILLTNEQPQHHQNESVETQQQVPPDNMDSSLSLKPSADASAEMTVQQLPTIVSYQEKFGLFVQSFLKVQDEYKSIMDLINTTAERATELKVRVNNLSFYFNFSPSSGCEDDTQKTRRRDRVLYELRDIQTLSTDMQNDYSCLKLRLKNRYLVVLDEFCSSFKEWEEKHSSGAAMQ
jgi:hypothetical protein